MAARCQWPQLGAGGRCRWGRWGWPVVPMAGGAGGRWRGAGGRRQGWRGPEAKWALTDFLVSEYSLTMCERGGGPLRILKKKILKQKNA